MNKYEFISDFLNKENFDSSQKERVISLIITELKSDGIAQSEIENRLALIEHKLIFKNSIENSEKDKANLPLQSDLPEYIDPKKLSQFLNDYNQHSLLKYTCHLIDNDGLNIINEYCATESFNIDVYQKLLSDSFKELAAYHGIPKNIYALINAYLNGSKEWSSDKIKVSWNSPEFKDWCRCSPGVIPSPGSDIIELQQNNPGFDFTPFRSKILGTTIGSFSQLVIHFKSLFHIRADNSLKRMIQTINTNKNWDNQFEFTMTDFRENIEFFTDVDKLLQAYQTIISIIQEVSLKYDLGVPKIKLALREEGNSIIFAIHHINSVYKKTIKNTIERIGQSHTQLINRIINGLCNLYIQADFGGNEFARINLWDQSDRKSECIQSFEGVEYQLIFK
jgi:hypothetical protein